MNKTVILSLLKISKEIYCIMSTATKMQYVQCDPETFDDEISVFLKEDEAKEKAKERQEETKELSEELAAHFAKGTFIIAVEEDNKIPLLKQKDGNLKDVTFQPIFTDIPEFMKFNINKKMKPVVVESVNLLMQVERKGQ